jgi:hypothetical protein
LQPTIKHKATYLSKSLKSKKKLEKKPKGRSYLNLKMHSGALFFSVNEKNALAGQKRLLRSAFCRATAPKHFSHTQKHNSPALPNLLPPSAAAAAVVVAPRQLPPLS